MTNTKNFYFIMHKGTALKYKHIEALKEDKNINKFKNSLCIFESPTGANKFILKYFGSIEKEFLILNTRLLK